MNNREQYILELVEQEYKNIKSNIMSSLDIELDALHIYIKIDENVFDITKNNEIHFDSINTVGLEIIFKVDSIEQSDLDSLKDIGDSLIFKRSGLLIIKKDNIGFNRALVQSNISESNKANILEYKNIIIDGLNHFNTYDISYMSIYYTDEYNRLTPYQVHISTLKFLDIANNQVISDIISNLKYIMLYFNNISQEDFDKTLARLNKDNVVSDYEVDTLYHNRPYLLDVEIKVFIIPSLDEVFESIDYVFIKDLVNKMFTNHKPNSVFINTDQGFISIDKYKHSKNLGFTSIIAEFIIADEQELSEVTKILENNNFSVIQIDIVNKLYSIEFTFNYDSIEIFD